MTEFENAVRDLIDWMRNNVGNNDDWPAEMNFDDAETAAAFCRRINRVAELLDNL